MISLLLGMAIFGTEPTGVVLRILGESSSNSVQFSVSVGEQPADSVWSDFLDRWIARFDVDHDGKLSRGEADTVPSLSNAAGSMIRLEFPTCDPNGDGLISRDELQDFYRTRGLSSVNIAPATHDRAAIEAGEIFWKLLDRDHDGQLSREELDSASLLLNRWDRNEDECLSIQELPTRSVSNIQKPLPVIDWLPDPKMTVDALTIPLRLDVWNRDSSDVRQTKDKLAAGLEWLDRKRIRVRLPSTTIVVHLGEASVQRIALAQQYLLGEINGLQTDTQLFEASQIHSDPTLEWLVPLYRAVDLDRDEKLSQVEIKSFVDLLAEGSAAQFSITMTIRGHNLFDHLDSNGDHQLDLTELTNAKRLVAGINRHDDSSKQIKALSQDNVPWSLIVDIRRGPMTGRFGRLRIAMRQSELRSRSPATALPRWFAAMDRNRDQILSPSEFLGPPHRFQELDRNSDGVITSDEVLIPNLDQTDPPAK